MVRNFQHICTNSFNFSNVMDATFSQSKKGDINLKDTVFLDFSREQLSSEIYLN